MTNREAIGYMLLACRSLDYNREQVKDLYGKMYNMFDIKCEEEAEEQGFQWYNNLEEKNE
ncbi:hypothetical protein [Ornithinibacillus halophilus]|uniref:Uncharacterized protein n=1 Tax=Ornithinibacillus halophilus TaxID=930117 RepID=A0A1M5G1T7_9BACI|nr:hypothetical protein [Ornithinibacillus halophilus]SHF97666.1 hypothetical protein SAMN05216225_101129 [Ornithinibacillus halophilus]